MEPESTERKLTENLADDGITIGIPFWIEQKDGPPILAVRLLAIGQTEQQPTYQESF